MAHETGTDYTLDELMIAAMARELTGEVLVSAVTAMGMLAAHLARRTHAPELAILATPESGMDVTPVVTLTLGQFLTDAEQGVALSMEEVFDAIFLDRFRIWINPAQVDRHGGANISVIGPWEKPRVALVGSRGIPEDTTHLSAILYYLTTHSPRTVVERVDFRSGADYGPERDRYVGNAGAPTRLVTNLGVFDWGGPDHTLRAVSLHPGVTPEMVQEASGCPVVIPPAVGVTPAPDAEAVAIIRAADPLELRKLEFLAGAEAAEQLFRAYDRERQAFRAALGPRRHRR